MKKNFFKKGITIIETLLYATILVLIVGIVVQSLVSLLNLHRATLADKLIESSVSSAMSIMTREIRNAEMVDVANSVFGSSLGSLTLSGTDDGGAPKNILFSVSGENILQMTDLVSGEVSNLTSSKVMVTGLVYDYLHNTNSDGVRIFIQVETGNGNSIKSISLRSFSVLRNSY
jgi:type II secretory pathway component PulJ